MPHHIWTEHGGRGLTLSLSDKLAEFLVACLVLLTMIATTWIWEIFRLPIVLLYCRQPELQKRLGESMRESTGPLSVTGRFVSLAWGDNQFTRRWHVYLIAFLLSVYSFGTTAYSIIGPYTLTQKSEKNPLVLAKSYDGSRMWVRNFTGAPNEYMPGAGTEILLNASLAGESYFRNCYEKSNHLQCKYLSKDRLVWTSNDTATCPFKESSACSSKNHAAYRVDSGPIPLRDIGFNIIQNITLARRSICTPLDFYDWVLRFDGDIFTRGGLYFVNFGNENANGKGYFVAGDLKGQGVNDYVLRVRQFFYTGVDVLHKNLSLLEPGDRNMILLNAMGVTYEMTTIDPVFRVNKEQPIKIDDMLRQTHNLPITTKYMAETFGIISCVDQYQICLDSPSGCTGFRPISTYTDDLQLDLTKDHNDQSLYSLEVQAVLHALYQPIQLTSIGQVLHSMGASAMAVRRTGLVNHEYQRRVEGDQWKKEIDRWFGLGLAGLQVAVVESVLAVDADGSKEGLIDVLKFTPKIKEKLGKIVLYKDGEFTNIEGRPLIGILAVIVLGGILRAFNGPSIRLMVKYSWLSEEHVRAFDCKILNPGWESLAASVIGWVMKALGKCWQTASRWTRGAKGFLSKLFGVGFATIKDWGRHSGGYSSQGNFVEEDATPLSRRH